MANPPHPHAHALGLSQQEKDLLVQTVQNMRIAPKVAHSVSINYLQSLKSSSEDVERSIIQWLCSNKDFECAMFQVARDAIVFSTLAGALKPEAFRFCLTLLAPVKWPQIEKMRRALFEIGVDLLLESAADEPLNTPLIITNAASFLSR